MAPLLIVYFTSDVHGYLYPTNFQNAEPHPMGLLSMRFPKDENTLVIDGGDMLQGSPLTYFGRSQSVDLPIARAMNRRGYDYITLGNHDFNYGRSNLRRYLSELHARCLCANVDDLRGELPILPCAVHTLGNGLRVGLVGIVTDWINRWEKPENLMDLSVVSPLERAKKAVASMDCDVLVGIYHGGIERDPETGRLLSSTDENIACRLCDEIPFDLLLTGHQHMAVAGARWNHTHLVQTPCNGTAYIKVEMDADRHFTSVLCPVSDHAELTEEESLLFNRVNKWLDFPIGRLSRAMWPEDKLKMATQGTPIADFFNQVQLWASDADISCAALANSVRGFDRNVTVRDVVATYVYPNTLKILQVSGAVLRQALEQCARYFDRDSQGNLSISESFLLPKEAHFNYDYFSGIEYTFDLSRPAGQRVVSLTRRGEPVTDTQTFTLCMCDYRATGAGDFDFYQSCPVVREIQTDISELILRYLETHKLVKIPSRHPLKVLNKLMKGSV
jgi:2',3'-cyclic-nucleotide 2'-phosphodiesterase/3'-nucleotidase